MSKKKSYMSKSNLIKEGFFDKIKSFLTSRPKLKGKDKGLKPNVKLDTYTLKDFL